MPLSKSCLSCKYNHDLAVKSSNITWCLLRKIRLDSQIASFAYCHHWTHSEPSLPLVKENNLISDTQLDFERDLVVN